MATEWAGWFNNNLQAKYEQGICTAQVLNLSGLGPATATLRYILAGDMVWVFDTNTSVVKVGAAALALAGLPAKLTPNGGVDGQTFRCWGLTSNGTAGQPGLATWVAASQQFNLGVDVVSGTSIVCGQGGFPAGFIAGLSNFGMIYRLR